MKTLTYHIAGLLLLFSTAVLAQDFEQAPIEYSKATPSNRVSKLITALESGKKKLTYEEERGFLKSLLQALDVPVSSQMLVYSKTSLQRQRIAPETPRALYFNDDTYIGFCQNGEVLEISVADSNLGTVFYTLEQDNSSVDPQTHEAAPRIVRQTDNCLMCHGSSTTKGVPGHVVRSVFSDPVGLPLLSMGTYRIDHTSPFEQRWGGWYVTGTHGSQKHLGNLIVRAKMEPEQVDNSAGQNVTDLSKLCDVSPYLTPHSDIVALMVLEHQADAHNYLTQANFTTRQALHYEAMLNKELGKKSGERWDSTNSRIKSVCEPLVEYLLFSEEAPLKEKIVGTSNFTTEFSQRLPRDKHGRSLRDFDLSTRLFKYPCSYLIYSESFTALPHDAKTYVYRRLHEILSQSESNDKFKHLNAKDRRAIHEILSDTLPDFPKS